MKKKYIITIAVAGAVFMYFIYTLLFVHPKVKVAEIKRGNLVTIVYATGNVTADSLATLRCESGGIVTYIGTHEGMYVRRGQLLLKTDDSNDLLRVKQAQTNMQSAQIELRYKSENLERLKTLFETNSATQKSLDDAQRDYELAKSVLEQNKIALNLAEEQLSKTRVTAPFNGIIISSKAKLGDFLLPNAACFELISPTSVLVEAQVDEQDFSRVKNRQTCVVAFDAFGNQKFNGYVYRIVPKTDEATKTSNIFIKLLNPPQNLNVGMTATVNIISNEVHDAIIVPRTAVIQLPNSNIVYTVRDGRAKETRVDLGPSDGKYFVLLGNTIMPGTIVISEPGPKIRNGMRVKVIE
jgi:RND family efflux transporter MFP subunit